MIDWPAGLRHRLVLIAGRWRGSIWAAVEAAAAAVAGLRRHSLGQGHGTAAAAGKRRPGAGRRRCVARGGVAGAHRDRLPHLAGAPHPRRVQVRPAQGTRARAGPWKTRPWGSGGGGGGGSGWGGEGRLGDPLRASLRLETTGWRASSSPPSGATRESLLAGLCTEVMMLEALQKRF